MKKFSIIVIFIMILVFDCVANETIQTQALQESSSVAIENMSVEQLRARVKTLEAELIGYVSLKEENKRLRIQLRKMRMQMYDAQATKDFQKNKTSEEEKSEDKDSEAEKIIPQKRKEQTFWEWFTQ
ncbi:MAG: hypothetical protein E7035_06205 [Verrucomicrobiaceae bacterium]|nr:hypothetical protein [Verrucomicrobiaceae bacterium]